MESVQEIAVFVGAGGRGVGLDIVVVGGVAAATMVVALLVFSLTDKDRRRRESRLRRVASAGVGKGAPTASRTIRRGRGEAGLSGRLARILPNPRKLDARLTRTGRTIGPGKYGIICVIVGVICWGCLSFWGAMPSLANLLGGVALGLYLPHLWVGSAIGRREAAFLKNLPEGIDVMVRGLKAGLPVTESLAAAGKESPEPVGGILRAASDLVRMGRPIEEAIEKTAERMCVPELRFLAITLSVQKETGGNLTETLANLSDILRRRRQMKLKVRAVSSEARASAMILGSLPFVMFAILLLVNRGYVMQLFDDPRGHVMVGIGLGSIAAGVFVMAKMIKFDI